MNIQQKLLIALTLLVSISLSAQIKVETISVQFDGSGGYNMGEDGLLYLANFGQGLDNSNGTQVWVLDYKNGEQIPKLFANGLSGASGNDFDSEGNLFQSNIAAGRVSKITPNGSVSQFSSNGISCNVGVNVDEEDNVYVCNCCGQFQNTIRKVTKEGVSSLFSSGGMFSCPNGITRDENGNLYVSNFGNGRVVKINPQGVASSLNIIPGGSNGHLIYSEKEHVLYVASHGTHRIYKVTLDGVRTVLAGSGIRGNTDGNAASSTFSRPNGMTLSSNEDTLFVGSSIPITDAGGRPLNPSVVRMITGIRGLTATNELTQEDFNVRHLPSQNAIEITGNMGKIVKVILINNNGQIITTQQNSSNQNSIIFEVPNIHLTGMFYINLVSKNGNSISKKILLTI